jgi:hypothetical protein
MLVDFVILRKKCCLAKLKKGLKMKKCITIIVLLIILGCAPAPGKYYIKTVYTPSKIITKVAIIPENLDTYWVSSFSYRALITELMHVGFTVIERSNLTEIVDELKLQGSGLIKQTKDELDEGFETRTLDKEAIAKIGEVLGVEHLVLTYFVPSGRKLHMATIRLVEVETAIILSSTTVITPDNGGEKTDIIMKQVAMDMVQVVDNKKTIIRDELFGSENSNTPMVNIRLKGDDLIIEKNENY